MINGLSSQRKTHGRASRNLLFLLQFRENHEKERESMD